MMISMLGTRIVNPVTSMALIRPLACTQTLFNSYEQRSFAKVARKRAKFVLNQQMREMDGSVEEYFDKLMRRGRETEKGVIDLPRRNFEDVLRDHVHTEQDYKDLLGAFYNYQGHRNTFPQTSTDNLLRKALELEQPSLAYELIGNHAELMIHPHPKLIRSFFRAVLEQNDYEKMKEFFETTKGRYFLNRPSNLNKTVIEMAYEAGDKETVIEAYLDILDYERELEGADLEFFKKVLESMSYEEVTDHVLFG